MNLNEKRLETGNKNMMIISLEKSKIFFSMDSFEIA